MDRPPRPHGCDSQAFVDRFAADVALKKDLPAETIERAMAIAQNEKFFNSAKLTRAIYRVVASKRHDGFAMVDLILHNLPSQSVLVDCRRNLSNILTRLFIQNRKEICCSIATNEDRLRDLFDTVRKIPKFDDYELQELVLDWLYMLWRGWNRIKHLQSFAERLHRAMHPKILQCMTNACECSFHNLFS